MTRKIVAKILTFLVSAFCLVKYSLPLILSKVGVLAFLGVFFSFFFFYWGCVVVGASLLQDIGNWIDKEENSKGV